MPKESVLEHRCFRCLHFARRDALFQFVLAAADQFARRRICRFLERERDALDARTEPLVDQHRQLSQKLKGHFAYFGISGNYKRLDDLRTETKRIWC